MNDEFFHQEHARHRRAIRVLASVAVMLGMALGAMGLYALHLASEMAGTLGFN